MSRTIKPRLFGFSLPKTKGEVNRHLPKTIPKTAARTDTLNRLTIVATSVYGQLRTLPQEVLGDLPRGCLLLGN
jgi:hypothetical protein